MLHLFSLTENTPGALQVTANPESTRLCGSSLAGTPDLNVQYPSTSEGMDRKDGGYAPQSASTLAGLNIDLAPKSR